MFLQITRQQVCEHGIRMAEIAPGPVDTPLTDNWPPEMLKQARETKSILDPKVVADQVMNMLTQPREVTIRNVVMMPTGFKL
jgi:ribitol 2-dehydrogenase